jgi:flavin-binding protein dodecin
VAKAAKAVRNIVGVELVGQTAVVEGGRITEYRADVKIAFVVEEVTEG